MLGVRLEQAGCAVDRTLTSWGALFPTLQWYQVGGDETLLDDSTAFAAKASRAVSGSNLTRISLRSYPGRPAWRQSYMTTMMLRASP